MLVFPPGASSRGAFRDGEAMRDADARAAARIDVAHPDGEGHTTRSGRSGTYFGMPVPTRSPPRFFCV